MTESAAKRTRVAIVGAGVSGLTCAWVLKNGRRWPSAAPQNDLDVELFESADRLGGHTWTVRHEDRNTKDAVDLDMGFQVFNLTNYGNLVELFEALGVDSQPSTMSFSYSKTDGVGGSQSRAVEWSSNNGVFGIFTNALRDALDGDKWKLTRDLVRFERDAEGILEDESLEGATLEDWLGSKGYSSAFAENYMYPMCSAIWSSPKDQVKQFPIQWLARFVCNHHLHKVTSMQRPLWRVVRGGSRTYVDAIESNLRDGFGRSGPTKIRLGCEVRSVEYMSARGTYRLSYRDVGKSEVTKEFDVLILGTHADTALNMLFYDEKGNPNDAMTHLNPFKSVLESIPYCENRVVLHTDRNWMPAEEKSWASWNVLERAGGQGGKAPPPVCMSYWANLLSSLPKGCDDYFVTLNPWQGPAAKDVILEGSLAHPQFSAEAERAQKKLQSVNGSHGLYLCGAWCGYGFHEDGVRSAIDVCDRLGILTPWHYKERQELIDTPERWGGPTEQFRPLSPRATYRQATFTYLFDQYMKRCIKKGFLRIILPSGHELKYGDPNTTMHIDTHVLKQEGDSANSTGGARECVCRQSLKAESTLRVFDLGLFEDIVLNSDIGLGESFFRRKFVVDDLFVLLTILSKNLAEINSSTNKWVLGLLSFFGNKWNYLKWLLRSNTVTMSRKNIEEHYDAGNEMYRLFLDENMVYSSGIYTQDDGISDSSILTRDTLEAVQMRKLRKVVEMCEVQKNHSVLEIGCGLGAMAILLATEYACNVTGITLSTEQLEVCNQRAKDAGVSHLCTFLLCDYRNIERVGAFDRVISIEMIEAVGHEYFGTYFATISRWLKPGGKAAIQAISYPDDRYDSQLYTSDFIKQHIFPGGHLPCKRVMLECAGLHGLHLEDCIDIGKSYAITLMKWRENWVREHASVRKLGYSQEFWLKYLFYFVYCEVGFNEGLIVDYVLRFHKK